MLRVDILFVAKLAGEDDLIRPNLVSDLERARLQVAGNKLGNFLALLLLVLNLALKDLDQVRVGYKNRYNRY